MASNKLDSLILIMPQNKSTDVPTKEIASARKAITDQDRQIAVQAFAHFKDKKNDLCLQQMKRLSELRSHDTRVSLNKAIAEYLVSNCCKTDEFIKQINLIKKQLEFSTGDELDDIDQSFFLYNQAVLHYHLKQYKSAISILERLYKIIEPLGEFLAAKVCMLFVEVYMLNNQLDQAFGMITYIESTILGANKASENGTGQRTELIKMVQPKLHMFKVRLYLTKGFYAQCKRELRIAMNTNKSNELLFMKAHVEYCTCNLQESINLLNSVQVNKNQQNPVNTMCQNNVACIHFLMRKYNLAVSHFRKAFEENARLIKSLPSMEKTNSFSGRPLQTLTMNHQSEVMYNIGVSLLFAGRPSQAFECLMEAQSLYRCNPRYWLRLAECCVAVHQKNEDKQMRSKSSHNSLYVHSVIGSGVHRKVIVKPEQQNTGRRHEIQSSAMPATTLEFSNLCLTNANILLPSATELEENMTKFLQNEKPIPGDDDKDAVKRSFIGRIYVDAPPGDPMQTKEIYSLKASILCCHTFVCLALGDYFKSANLARTLLQMTHIIGPQKLLGHLYLAESLMKLDKIPEALQELAIENIKAYQRFDQEVERLKTEAAFPNSLNKARVTMMLNMASAYCCRGEYEKCKVLLRQIMNTDMNPSIKSHAILMSVYCDLQLGKLVDALNLIKRNEIFPSGRLIDRVEAARAMSHIPQNIIQQMSHNEPIRKVMGF